MAVAAIKAAGGQAHSLPVLTVAAADTPDYLRRYAHFKGDDTNFVSPLAQMGQGKLLVLPGTHTVDMAGTLPSLTSGQFVEIGPGAVINASGNGSTETWLFTIDGSSTPVVRAGIIGCGTVNFATAGNGLLRVVGDVTEPYLDSRLKVNHTDSANSVNTKPVYLLGNTDWGIRGGEIGLTLDGVSYGTSNENSGAVFIEGNVRDVRGNLNVRRVNYGLGTKFAGANPTSVKSWTGTTTFSNRANMSDGDLATAATFQWGGTHRLIICSSQPFNRARFFLGVTVNTQVGRFLVAETPTSATPLYTIGDTTTWAVAPLTANDTVTASGSDSILMGQGGEIVLGHIREEDWVEATIDGVMGYWLSLRPTDSADAAAALSAGVNYQEVIVAAVPSDCSFDLKVQHTGKAGYHYRPAQCFTMHLEASEIGSHMANDNSTETQLLTSDEYGAGDDDDRYFASRDNVTYINGNGGYDTAVLHRCAVNCRTIGTVTGVFNSAAYEQADAGAGAPQPDIHKPRHCHVDLQLTNVGRVGARIRGDDNEIRLHVFRPGQLKSLATGSADRAAVEFAKGNSSAPEGNKLWLSAEDDTGRMELGIFTEADADAVNYIMALQVQGAAIQPVDDNGGALVFMNPKHNLGAATNPGVTNDVTEGYSTGSMWVNTTTPAVYVCISAADGAADWDAVT